MKVERFTGEVSTDLQLYNPRGLWVAIGLIVPQNKRRRVLGYKLASVAPISGDNLKKQVTIAVTYQ
jgi:hypothetical protein